MIGALSDLNCFQPAGMSDSYVIGVGEGVIDGIGVTDGTAVGNGVAGVPFNPGRLGIAYAAVAIEVSAQYPP